MKDHIIWLITITKITNVIRYIWYVSMADSVCSGDFETKWDDAQIQSSHTAGTSFAKTNKSLWTMIPAIRQKGTHNKILHIMQW